MPLFWILPKSAWNSFYNMPDSFLPCARLPDNNQSESLGIVVSSAGVLCASPAYDFIWQGQPFQLWQKRARSVQLIGLLRGRPCYVLEMDDAEIESSYWYSLRTLLENIAREDFLLVSRAVQILQWSRNHRFCGNCGGRTYQREGEHALVCDNCRLHFYPRISPCAIVLVTRGNECLLARNTAWREGWYSALAGFVEAAESVEQTIHREIAEEVGIQVTNLRYFSSESWPFPGQLMLGFYADYQAGEIVVDGVEIAEAKWCRYDALPSHPSTVSLSGRLIKNFVDSWKTGSKI